MEKEAEEKKEIGSSLVIKRNQLILIIVGIFLLFQIGWAWYLLDVVRVREEKANLTNPQEPVSLGKTEVLDLSNNDPEVGGVVENVSRHILLPAKQFTVGTVKDADTLIRANPVLFQYVRNGQKLLIYETGVIVYDPAVDKVVDVIQYYPIRLQQLSEAVSSTLQENK